MSSWSTSKGFQDVYVRLLQGISDSRGSAVPAVFTVTAAPKAASGKQAAASSNPDAILKVSTHAANATESARLAQIQACMTIRCMSMKMQVGCTQSAQEGIVWVFQGAASS